MKTIGIIGPGLLGGSLGLALAGQYRRLVWARRAENRAAALELGAADAVCESAEEVIGQAELTVLAIPVQPTVDFFREHAAHFKPGAVVTDVGSLKLEICAAAERYLAPRGIRFVGSHPMAGTEKRGVGAAFAELYDNADVFVLTGGADRDAVGQVESVWRAVGAHPKELADAAAHDALVARTSHLLHIIASGLTAGILDAATSEEQQLRFAGCATGFRDSCRIAASNPAMWREITEKNHTAILQAMDEFETRYFALRRMIESGDFDGFERAFARSKELRDCWMEYKNSRH